MKKLCLFALGLIPLGPGFIMNWLMMSYPDSALPLPLIGIAFLLFWLLLGFATYRFGQSALASISLVHLAAFLALVLNLYQEIILARYWSNLLSTCTQFFYLPVLNLSFMLTVWSSHVWVAYIAGFFLMCLAYFIGFNIREHLLK